MRNPSKAHAIMILMAYGIGVLILILTIHTPFYIPCLFRLLTGIPCPACGLTGSFILAGRLDFIGAITANILFLPLIVGMTAYLICALLDIFSEKQAIKQLNSALNKRWIIAAAAVLSAISWYYNITLR